MLLFLLLLAGLTVLRFAVAAATPLAPDEAYYWVWSRALAPGYFDHPPMVALWIRIGTAIAGSGAFGVRLLGPISAALGSLLLVDTAKRLVPAPNSGVVAAALLNATLMFGVGSVIMTPDTPLLFFWTACLWAVVRSIDGRRGWWLLAGLFAGLALASKYTAVLLLGGVGLWMLIVPAQRRALRRKEPWFGAGLALLLFLPVVWWNATHGWASFLRQGGRVANWQPQRAAQFLGELVGGQFGLATPLVFVLCVAGSVAAVRHAWRSRDPGWTLLAALILPGTLVFVQHAFGARVQGNWPAILYPAAAIAAAGLGGTVWRRLRLPAVALGVGITGLVYAQAALALFPLPPRVDPIVRQLDGWDALARQVAAVARSQSARFVVATDYGLASELARDLPPGLALLGVEPRWALFNLPRGGAEGRIGILVWPERGAAPDAARWPGVRLLGQVERGTARQPVEAFLLYRLSGVPPGAVRLPAR